MWNGGHDEGPLYPSNLHHVLELYPIWAIRSAGFSYALRSAVIFPTKGILNGAKPRAGIPFDQVYINSGTWRAIHEMAAANPTSEEFAGYKVMTYLVFYQGMSTLVANSRPGPERSAHPLEDLSVMA